MMLFIFCSLVFLEFRLSKIVNANVECHGTISFIGDTSCNDILDFVEPAFLMPGINARPAPVTMQSSSTVDSNEITTGT